MKRVDLAHPATLARILVIDDESDMLTNYKRLLSSAGYECLAAADASRLMNLLVEFQPDLVLTDLVMPNSSGLDVLERVHRYNEQIPVIIVTGHGSIETAVEAMKLRAVDFVTKPFSVQDLHHKIGSALKRRPIEKPSVETDAVSEAEKEWRCGFVGISPNITGVLNLVRKVARTDVNVLITGESGTGKELVARGIHHLSSRRNEIFVPMDCASLPESLLESELFGYRKGAFTGANTDKMGLFEFAHKGTLFLDEIGELQPSLQSKLLRVLQERRFRPIGGRSEIEVDIRVLAATNRDLEEAVQTKTFRSDLFYRLNVVVIHLPSLKEQTEDIALLADHFLRQFNRSNQSPVQGISPSALAALRAYRWPGNVRELQNVIERAITLAAGPLIELHDLSDGLQSAQVKLPVLADSTPPANEEPHGPPAAAPLFQARTELVGKFERDFLVSLLLEHDFNIVRAAAASGCHRRTLYRMILRHGIDLKTLRPPRKDGASRPKRGASATFPDKQ
jgi:DNA-binding NtrC family response regulator